MHHFTESFIQRETDGPIVGLTKSYRSVLIRMVHVFTWTSVVIFVCVDLVAFSYGAADCYGWDHSMKSGELLPRVDVLDGSRPIERTCTYSPDLINVTRRCINIYIWLDPDVGWEPYSGNCTHQQHVYTRSDHVLVLNISLPFDPLLDGAYVDVYCMAYCGERSLTVDKQINPVICYPPAQPRLSTGDAIVANWESMNLTVTPWQPPQTDHEQCTHLSVVYKIREVNSHWRNCSRLEKNSCFIDKSDFKIDATYDVMIKASNALGTRTSNISISSASIVKPNKPRVFKLLNVSSTHSTLSFRRPCDRNVGSLMYNVTCISQRSKVKTVVINSADPFTSVTFTKLVPYTRFTCSVTVVPSIGGFVSEPASLIFRTLDDVPAQAPRVISYDKQGSNQVIIYWEVLKEEFRHGSVNYRINCSKCIPITNTTLSAHAFHTLILLKDDVTRQQPVIRYMDDDVIPDIGAEVSVKACTKRGCKTSAPLLIQNKMTADIEMIAIARNDTIVDFTLKYQDNITRFDFHSILVYCRGNSRCLTEVQTVLIPENSTRWSLDLPRGQSFRRYRFGVFVDNKKGVKSAIDWVECTYLQSAEPLPPVDLQLSAVGTGSCTVTWDIAPCTASRAYVTSFILVWCSANDEGECTAPAHRRHLEGKSRNYTLLLDASAAPIKIVLYSVSLDDRQSAYHTDPLIVKMPSMAIPAWVWGLFAAAFTASVALIVLIRYLWKRTVWVKNQDITIQVPPKHDIKNDFGDGDPYTSLEPAPLYSYSIPLSLETVQQMQMQAEVCKPLFGADSGDYEDEGSMTYNDSEIDTVADTRRPNGYHGLRNLTTVFNNVPGTSSARRELSGRFTFTSSSSSPSLSNSSSLSSVAVAASLVSSSSPPPTSSSSTEDIYACFAIRRSFENNENTSQLSNTLNNPRFFSRLTQLPPSNDEGTNIEKSKGKALQDYIKHNSKQIYASDSNCFKKSFHNVSKMNRYSLSENNLDQRTHNDRNKAKDANDSFILTKVQKEIQSFQDDTHLCSTSSFPELVNAFGDLTDGKRINAINQEHVFQSGDINLCNKIDIRKETKHVIYPSRRKTNMSFRVNWDTNYQAPHITGTCDQNIYSGDYRGMTEADDDHALHDSDLDYSSGEESVFATNAFRLIS